MANCVFLHLVCWDCKGLDVQLFCGHNSNLKNIWKHLRQIEKLKGIKSNDID